MGLLLALPAGGRAGDAAGAEVVYDYRLVEAGSIGCDQEREVGAKLSFLNARLYDSENGIPQPRYVQVRRGLKVETIALPPDTKATRDALVGLINIEVDYCMSPFGNRVLRGGWSFHGSDEDKQTKGSGRLSDDGVIFRHVDHLSFGWVHSLGYELTFDGVPMGNATPGVDDTLVSGVVKFDVALDQQTGEEGASNE